MVTRFKTSHKRITLGVTIQQIETEEFYLRFRATLFKRTENEIVMMLGDFNTKAEDDST